MINIDKLIKESLKSGNKTELKTYRNLKAEFQKVRTAKNAPEWNDALEMQIISKYSRILEDAILQFSQAHRDDLVSEYTSELEVVKKLLPEPVNESQIMYELATNKKTVQDIFTIGMTPDGHAIPRSPGDRMRKMEELAERLSRTDINNNRTNVQPAKPIGKPGINKEVKKDIFSDPKALLDMMY